MSDDHTYALKIHLISFDLPRSLAKGNDEIRVSITTVPEENKQAFFVPARRMRNANLNFCVNVKIPPDELPDDFIFSGTEKVIVVFRKKNSFFGSPIIASTLIPAKEFPKDLSEPVQIKTLNIYEPLQRGARRRLEDRGFIGTYSKELPQSHPEINRKIIGRMEVQLSLANAVPLKEVREEYMSNIKKASTLGDINDENDENIFFYEDKFDEYQQL